MCPFSYPIATKNRTSPLSFLISNNKQIHNLCTYLANFKKIGLSKFFHFGKIKFYFDEKLVRSLKQFFFNKMLTMILFRVVYNDYFMYNECYKYSDYSMYNSFYDFFI